MPSQSAHSASTKQIFYYDADFMQRRMDYAVEVNGDVLVAQYQYEPKTFRGLVFPTQRRVHRRSPDGTADQRQTSVPVERAGSAGGVLQTGQRLGSAAGIAVTGSVFYGRLASSHG